MGKEILLIAPDGSTFLALNKVEIHTHLGKINLKNIKGKKIKSNKGVEFLVVTPTFIEKLMHVKRGPAVILPKDLAMVAIYAGIKPGMKILDMGTGSGWLAAYLAYIVGPTGQIITYEKNKAFAKLAMNNFSSLGLNNIKLKIKDAYKGFLEKDADVITIDLPNPERVLKFAHRSLKANGILVAYLPQITQILKLVKNLKKAKFLPYKIVECFERNWIIKGQIARPEHDALSHTAFILFAKKI